MSYINNDSTGLGKIIVLVAAVFGIGIGAMVCANNAVPSSSNSSPISTADKTATVMHAHTHA